MTYPLNLCLAHKEPCSALLRSRLDLEEVFRGHAVPNLCIQEMAPDQVVRQITINILVNDICGFWSVVAGHVTVFLVDADEFPNITLPMCAGKEGNEI